MNIAKILVVLVIISARIVKLIIQSPHRAKHWKEVIAKMGAVELKFNGTFEKDQVLKDFQCPHCQQFLMEQDISEKNYQLWVSDYANEVEKSEFFADRLGRNLTCYNLTFWLKSVEHQECPETETCESCYERFLTVNMKEFEGDYYCWSCCRTASKEVKHE